MNTPCKECPFSTAFEGRYNSEQVILFLASALEEGDHEKQCHMTDYAADCEGARRFFAGETEGVFPSVIELARARAKDSLAVEFLSQVERLYQP